MTNKLFIGIIPLLTACTIDLEMQLEVGLKDKAEDLENLEELLMEEGADLLDMGDSDGEPDESDESGVTVDETTASCEVQMFDLTDVLVGEELFVEWDIFGDPQEETVIALLQGQDVLHIDFLPMEEMGYIMPVPEEAGEYSIYVASGVDLHHPDCFTMNNFNVLESTSDPDSNVDTNVATDNNSCESIDDVERLPAVQTGDVILLDWDADLFDSTVEIVMYHQEQGMDDVIFVDLTQNVGFYELFINEDMEQGTYGVSLVSPEVDRCVHYELRIDQPF